MNIPSEIQHHFGLKPEGFLGGRLNKHWRVTRKGERLVLRRWHKPEDVQYEQAVRSQVAATGWPVPLDVSEVVLHDGFAWSLMTFLPGEPHPHKNSPEEQRQRGRLLAEFHLSTAELVVPGSRCWRGIPEMLHDPAMEQVFLTCPKAGEARLLLWHLEKARELAAEVDDWHETPLRLLHGDFTPWNLLFQDGRLSGLLDFELSGTGPRLADFCLAWRGEYDAVIHGYHRVNPLSEMDWRRLTPLWWAFLLELARDDLLQGQPENDWVVKMLLRRSPLIPVAPYIEQ